MPKRHIWGSDLPFVAILTRVNTCSQSRGWAHRPREADTCLWTGASFQWKRFKLRLRERTQPSAFTSAPRLLVSTTRVWFYLALGNSRRQTGSPAVDARIQQLVQGLPPGSGAKTKIWPSYISWQSPSQFAKNLT